MNWANLLKISVDDNMYQWHDDKGLAQYIQIGLGGINTICSELERINLWPKTILDMPSGYGRVLRFMKVIFPNAKIYACDVRRDAVDFCQDTFNVHSVYSKINFDEIIFPDSVKFDLIWAGSILTHLTPQGTLSFIKFCLDNLSSMGILIATSHGSLHYERLGRDDKMGLTDDQIKFVKSDYDDIGYGYGKYLHLSNPSYDYLTDWGISLIKYDWFDHLSSELGFKIVGFRERGWVGQDVIVIRDLTGQESSIHEVS